MTGLNLPALKLLVATGPVQSRQVFAAALREAHQQLGERGAQELFESVLEGLGPASKWVLRTFNPWCNR